MSAPLICLTPLLSGSAGLIPLVRQLGLTSFDSPYLPRG
jgi:hypothetical protein